MASYTVNSGERAAHAKSLSANTADTVTFAGNAHDGGYRSIEVANHPGSAGIIYAVADGSTAAVAGPFTSIVFPGQAVTLSATVRGSGSVSLISSSTATYSVTEL